MELATKNEMELVMEAPATEPGRNEPEEDLSRVDPALLGRLLAMAHRYRSEGNVRQATELYWTLADDYPGTPQADAARAVLLELATAYERGGNRHLARGIYERLL